MFRRWQSRLPRIVQVQALELPGRGLRSDELPLTRIEPMVEDIARTVEQELDRPFALFGHSMGALIAFELAHHLWRTQRRRPVCLFVSGHPAPHIPPDRVIHNLPAPELIVELRKYNGTPPDVLDNPELLDCLLPLIRADFELTEMYRYTLRPPLECDIKVYGGTDDPDTSMEGLNKWQMETSKSCSVTVLPGDHFFVVRSQDSILKDIGHVLARAVFH
jgi:medium-chain acyl-[acyl-carrier-protein] hydrolase